jgi:hypothetical protein
MKLAKSILCGVAALGITAGSALAQDEPYYYVIAEPSSDGQVAWNDSPSEDVTAYYIYDVDDDMDGKPDRQMIIEQRDTLAFAPSDAGLEPSSID